MPWTENVTREENEKKRTHLKNETFGTSESHNEEIGLANITLIYQD